MVYSQLLFLSEPFGTAMNPESRRCHDPSLYQSKASKRWLVSSVCSYLGAAQLLGVRWQLCEQELKVGQRARPKVPAGASSLVYWQPPRQHSAWISITCWLKVIKVLTAHKAFDIAWYCVAVNKFWLEWLHRMCLFSLGGLWFCFFISHHFFFLSRIQAAINPDPLGKKGT